MQLAGEAARPALTSADARSDVSHVVTPGAAGTPGYRDPAYEASMEYRCVNYIYSLGVLLLCLLTGRPAGRDEGHLCTRFAAFLVDPEGHAPTFVEASGSCLSSAQAALLARLARDCTQPNARPVARSVREDLQTAAKAPATPRQASQPAPQQRAALASLAQASLLHSPVQTPRRVAQPLWPLQPLQLLQVLLMRCRHRCLCHHHQPAHIQVAE